MHIVYGGAFNPPTKAHFNIVNKLLRTYPNSTVIVIPVGDSYKKDNLESFKHRFSMLKLMFLNVRGVIISKIEERKQFNGTIATLNELSERFNDLALVVGSDHLDTLDRWIDYKSLLSNYELIIMNRNQTNIDRKMLKYKGIIKGYHKLQFDHPASSTKVRIDFDKYKEWVKPEVLEYIKKNKLYGVNINV